MLSDLLVTEGTCVVRRPRVTSLHPGGGRGTEARRHPHRGSLYMSSKTMLAATVLACFAISLKTSSRSVKALS